MRIRHWSLISFGIILTLAFYPQRCQAWEWSDLWGDETPSAAADETTHSTPLTLAEVSAMRVRDLKRRLSRTHGYAADEVARMLDKKELIHALAFEEEKLRLKQEDLIKRKLVKRGILTAIISILVVMFWPLLQVCVVLWIQGQVILRWRLDYYFYSPSV